MEFGDVIGARAELAAIGRVRLRRERRAAWWDAVIRDARVALRGLCREPGFTAAVVLTLALGIALPAVLLAILGVYGTIAYLTARRTGRSKSGWRWGRTRLRSSGWFFGRPER